MAQDPASVDAPAAYPTVCLIGEIGAGKSSFGNVLIGSQVFGVGNGGDAGLARHAWKSSGNDNQCFFDDRSQLCAKSPARCCIEQHKQHKICVVDNEGLEFNAKDCDRVSTMFKTLKALTNTSAFVVVMNGTNPRYEILFSLFDRHKKLLKVETMLSHLMLVFTRWPTSQKDINKHTKKGITKASRQQDFLTALKVRFPKNESIKAMNSADFPCFFVDNDVLYDEDEDDDIKLSQLEEMLRFYKIASRYSSVSAEKLAAGGKGGTCIANSGQVNVIPFSSQVVSKYAIKDIRVNDLVETKDGYKKVVFIWKSDGNSWVHLYNIKHERGEIGLTSKHLIYVKGAEKPLYACALKVGDSVQCGHKVYAKIIGIDHIFCKENEVRSIITETGELIVGGARCSSYSHTTKLHCLASLTPLVRVLPSFTDRLTKGIRAGVVRYGQVKELWN